MRAGQDLTIARILLGLVAAVSLAAQAADNGQSLNVKIGLWEVTTIVTTSGEMPIPAGLMEKLTPAQRARVEERMKARSSDVPRVTKRKYCLTKEQLNKGATFGQDRKTCTRSTLASTSDRLEMRIECASQRQEIKSAGTLQVEATDPENVKGYVPLTTGGDRPEDSSSTFTARWIGPLCSPTK